MESLKQPQEDRDHYAESLKGESAMWQQRRQQMSEQMHTLREKKDSESQVQELETKLAELRSQMVQPSCCGPPRQSKGCRQR